MAIHFGLVKGKVALKEVYDKHDQLTLAWLSGKGQLWLDPQQVSDRKFLIADI